MIIDLTNRELDLLTGVLEQLLLAMRKSKGMVPEKAELEDLLLKLRNGGDGPPTN